MTGANKVSSYCLSLLTRNILRDLADSRKFGFKFWITFGWNFGIARGLHSLSTASFTYVIGCEVGETGKVIGIEHIEDLVKSSVDNIRRIPQLASRLDDGRIKIIAGDGRHGYSSTAPYDAIHVGAAAPELPPAVRKY